MTDSDQGEFFGTVDRRYTFLCVCVNKVKLKRKTVC